MLDRDVFLSAIELSGEARRAFLDQACGNDPELRQKVEALFAAHEQAGNFLAKPAVEATGAFTPGEEGDVTKRNVAELDHMPGKVLAGRYKLLEEIGEGGMGTVFVAEQTEPVKRKVAVKLIKPGMDSKNVLARFDAERQALAMMDHPNIARVLDAGLSEERRPYFVMEYIKGLPLTKYCDDVKLSIDERLKLFIQICQAVQHAHQKGIIHRDLKPGNILIALYDGKPVPKVIDFGLAKALHHSLTERTLHTGHEMVLGTPLYMSPEQAELNNLDIDTRSDIYSLGVILYELLTGVTPLEKKRFKEAAWMEILRIIKEEEPSKPSTKLSQSESLPSVAAQRQMEPKKLSSLMKGDLDWIVMKALEKDRSRRYETANGFAADVLRYLSGEAVTAVPPSAGYQLRKFVKRNKGKVIAASLILLTMFGGLIATSYGMHVAEQERQRANAAEKNAVENALKAMDAAEAERKAREREVDERKKAETAKLEAQAKEAEANAVVAFFENQVFAAARPKGQEGGLDKEVSLREAIVVSLPALGQGFAAQPLVETRLRRTLGLTFYYLAEYEQARDQSEQSLALFTRHGDPDHPDTLKSMHNLALSYLSLNRHAEALKMNEETLAIRKRVLPTDHLDTLKSMNNLALSYEALNRPADALKLREEVLAIQKRALPKDHPDTLRSMGNLAVSYAALNRPAEALKLREEVLAIQKRVLPKDHPDTLKSMMGMALSYAALNRPAEALKLREEVLAIQKRVLPKDHPDTLMSMNNLANSYVDLNRHVEALKLREEVLAIRKRVLPKDHPDTLGSMNNLAVSYISLNRHAEALKLLGEVLEIQKRVLPKDHPDTLTIMHNLANTYGALNRPADALKMQEEVLEIQKRVLPKDHPDTLKSMMGMAFSYVDLNRHAEALKLRGEVLAIRKRVLPKDHPDTLTSMHSLAASYAALQRHAEALKLFEEVLAIQKRVLPKDHPETLRSMNNLAASLFKLDRGTEAIPLIDECVAKAAGQAVDPRLIPSVIALRMGHFQKVGDPAGCRATSEMWEKLNRTDAGSLYDAACYWSVTAGIQMKTPGADAARLAKEDADRAMELLAKAVKAGYKNASHIKKDTDLDSLREREDFKKLMAELEKGAPQK